MVSAKSFRVVVLIYLVVGVAARLVYEPLVPMDIKLETNATVGAFDELAALITSIYVEAGKIAKLTDDAKLVKDLLKESGITINFNPSDYLPDLAKKNTPMRVMNVFDRGGSPLKRLAVEEALFGYKSPSRNHPYYGAINFWECQLGAVPHPVYGLAAFFLTNSVKEYSTFTYGDSLTQYEVAESLGEAAKYKNAISYFIKEKNPPKKKKDENGRGPYKPAIHYFMAYDGIDDELADLKLASKARTARSSLDEKQLYKLSTGLDWYFEAQIHGYVELEGAASKVEFVSGDFLALFGTANGAALVAIAKRIVKPLHWGLDCQIASEFESIADVTATEIWTKWGTLDTAGKKAAFLRLHSGKGSIKD